MNPEALHDVGRSTAKAVGDGFVNPGTPASPLVNYDQMTKATIRGNGNQTLRDGIIK